jgi:hypothetical protein
MFIVSMSNCTFDEWKKAFDADAEMQSQMMRDIMVGKVDDHTAIVSADVFAPEKVQELMSDPEFKGIHHQDMARHQLLFRRSQHDGRTKQD